ncbi:hypothetical protein BP5796_02944 [Coleophoma crateriformis]|uniref:Berberine/berberine-like domain-containing protein n=1 Tax=Coleophoma crateriformis TaxID=565419 RepID=A0A3D8SLR9_9HELO|nr:hypothetical protein BP5796_02944 [Coleophoma crateriformis]
MVNFELVTGAGEIINVNASSNSDLFVGLKGGVEEAAIYDEILVIPDLIASSMRITNVSSLTDELSAASTANTRNLFLTATFNNSAKMYETYINISNVHLEPLKNTTGLTWSLLFQPIPRIVSDHSIAARGNIMGVNRNKENLILFLIYITWHLESDDAKFTKAGYTTLNEILATGEELGVSNPYVYLNYAGKEQDVLAGYGEENIGKMQTLSKKYDPAGIFQSLVPGGWKILFHNLYDMSAGTKTTHNLCY